MKSYVILAVVLVVIAGMGLYAYYDNYHPQKNTSGSHVYLGAIYKGITQYTDFISASLNFSKGTNLVNNVYYVVLSIWDSNNSYDQIGVSSIKGHFYSTYSYTEMVNGSIKYIFDPSWFAISPGTHSISMFVTGGNVVFGFDNFSFTAFTGGSYFTVSTNEVIGNHSFSGLTVYEEIYDFNKSLPGISYNFSKVSTGAPGYPSRSIENWTLFSHNVTVESTSIIFIGGGVVNIYNVPSLSLKIVVNNLQSPAYLRVSNLNISFTSDGQYQVNLLKGNYTIYLEYQNQVQSYNLSLIKDSSYTINA